ncbi:hypothetical protein N0V94_005105 [Neodidymelliopsis sp. IMI 364377]|nr:hypothetical protein N0V94_005105 [Neodidymelliopsis sp. IMI 364377]
MIKTAVRILFDGLNLNVVSLLNTLGRPDYWAPQFRLEYDDAGKMVACDLFCQDLRWNIAVQGAPLSV